MGKQKNQNYISACFFEFYELSGCLGVLGFLFKGLLKPLGRQKSGATVAKEGSWSPRTPKKRCHGRQERFLEPANSQKEVSRSPRKVLGARKPRKRGVTVAKKGSWSPRTLKKRCHGRQEKFLKPAKAKKEVSRSPRKVLGAREPSKRGVTVAKKSSWSQ
jgi:hypothetical protein